MEGEWFMIEEDDQARVERLVEVVIDQQLVQLREKRRRIGEAMPNFNGHGEPLDRVNQWDRFAWQREVEGNEVRTDMLTRHAVREGFIDLY